MFQEIKDHAKCTFRNKFTICSYAGIGISLLMKYFEHETGNQIPFVDDVLIYLSLTALIATRFGADTYEAYTRMKVHIGMHGTIDRRFKDSFSSLYCDQIGIKMAAEESGLENLM